MKCLIVLSLLLYALVALGEPYPETYRYQILTTDKTTSTVTEHSFKKIPEEIVLLYRKELERERINPVVKTAWEKPFFTTWTNKESEHLYSLNFWGGLARIPGMNDEGHALVACHELGHILGGIPRMKIPQFLWASSEGQADYFAANVCLRRFFFKTKTPSDISGAAYTNGEEYCRQNATNERGRFHAVSDNLKIYSYVKKPFDKDLPTVVFFSGGPGASSRDNEFSLEGYNVLFFEERGMGCSRPRDKETFFNPEIYSALKSVQDVRVILRDYDLQHVILYGHSYGTVLATIFASEYPSIVEKVILEGTIFKGDVGIWRSEIRRKHLQETFQKLSLEEQEKILRYSNHPSLSPDWFSVVGTMMSYLNNGYDVYETFLHNILTMEEEAFIPFIQSFNSTPNFEREGEVVFGMLTCRELSGTLETSNLHLVFDREKILQWKEGSDVARSYCAPLGARASETIDLSKFPVHVPVVYLAGEQDGVTDRVQVRNHHAHVSQGEKILYVMKDGGHLPNLDPLKDDRECRDEEDCKALAGVKAQVRFFQSILRKSRLDEEELRSFNQLLTNPWYVSSEAQ